MIPLTPVIRSHVSHVAASLSSTITLQEEYDRQPKLTQTIVPCGTLSMLSSWCIDICELLKYTLLVELWE